MFIIDDFAIAAAAAEAASVAAAAETTAATIAAEQAATAAAAQATQQAGVMAAEQAAAQAAAQTGVAQNAVPAIVKEAVPVGQELATTGIKSLPPAGGVENPDMYNQLVQAFQEQAVGTPPPASPYAQLASGPVTSDVAPTPLVQTPPTGPAPLAETAPGSGIRPPTTKLPTMFNMPGASEVLSTPSVGTPPATPSLYSGINIPTGAMPAAESSPFVQGFSDVMNWIDKNPFKSAALGYMGLNAIGAFRSGQQPSTFGGPSYGPGMVLSPNFRPGPYTAPNVYRPSYAAGGITEATYPQAGIDRTQYATPTQMPTSAEVVASDYDTPTSPFTGEQKRMNSGGIIALAKGSNPEMFKQYQSMMEGNRPKAPTSTPEVKLMEDTDPDTKYQDALTATLIRQGKINKRANMPTPTLARPTPMGTINLAPPGTQQAASGGIMGYSLGGYAAGGNPRLLRGPGDGMSDDIPATIGNRQPARLADGEFVIPADVVSGLGNGSTEAGAKRLHKMMDKVRVARTGKKKQAPAIKADKYLA